MGAPFGNKYAVGSKGGGDKPDSVKFNERIAKMKEQITNEALQELAKNKVFIALEGAEELKDIQGLGLPIVLKGMTDKSEVSVLNLGEILKKTKE